MLHPAGSPRQTGPVLARGGCQTPAVARMKSRIEELLTSP